jgi:hypothetical protein
LKGSQKPIRLIANFKQVVFDCFVDRKLGLEMQLTKDVYLKTTTLSVVAKRNILLTSVQIKNVEPETTKKRGDTEKP